MLFIVKTIFFGGEKSKGFRA